MTKYLNIKRIDQAIFHTFDMQVQQSHKYYVLKLEIQQFQLANTVVLKVSLGSF
jgi:hypothetical protein